jgi:hypothetical protein
MRLSWVAGGFPSVCLEYERNSRASICVISFEEHVVTSTPAMLPTA